MNNEQARFKDGWKYGVRQYPDGGIWGYRNPSFPDWLVYTDGNLWYAVRSGERHHRVKSMWQACQIVLERES